MSSGPRISVVIPCRNMGKFVGGALDSVFAQTFPVHEVIVIDDGSTDETAEVLARYRGRVQVITGAAEGSATARNFGILASTGDHIAFLDADDTWMPTKLARQIPLLRDDQGFVFTDYYRSTDPQRPGTPVLSTYAEVAEGEIFTNILRENFISTSSVLLRKSLLGRTGIFKPALIGGQDFDMWLRLAERTRFGWIREPLVYMRRHAGNITGTVRYPYYHARVWEEILSEHGSRRPQDRAYIQRRYRESLYDAGRHAIRQRDIPAARGYLAKAWAQGGYGPRTALWYCISRLPTGLVNLLLSTKRTLAKSLAAKSATDKVIDA